MLHHLAGVKQAKKDAHFMLVKKVVDVFMTKCSHIDEQAIVNLFHANAMMVWC